MKSIPSSALWRGSNAKESELAAAEGVAALVRGLRRAQGFALFLAVCNKPAECDELIRLLEEAMPGVAMHHVRASPETSDLLEEVVAQAPEMAGPVLITDIDRAVPWKSPQHPILEKLNLRRPDWPKRVNWPVVLWITEPLLTLLAGEAPDFLDWRSDTIHFPDLSNEQVQLVREIALPSDFAGRMSLKASEERITELKQRLAESAHDTDRATLAARGGWLLELARHLTSVGGRWEEALQAAQEAVEIRRRLAQDRPDAFLPDLAGSLNNLGNRLSALGRREEALQAAQEAVEIYRRLAQDRPDAFLPDLAMSLNNLGNRLSDLGRREEALQAAQEAVEIYRRLAQDRPDAFLPDLAGSLNNLGTMLRDLGRREEALQAAQEAVEIYRRLAQDRPDAFLPDLAGSLNNLGNRLRDLDRREEALQAAQEAVEIYRRLAQDRPDAFLPDLAGSLNNLGNSLSALGRREEALQAAQEAVEIYRRLAQDRPDAFLPYLASSLNNLGTMLRDLGRREEALQAAQEAVEIYRRLAQDRPDAFLPDLARSLGVLGTCLAADVRLRDAVAAFAEGVRALAPAFSRLPQAFASLMIALVSDYQTHVKELGETPDMELLAPILAKLEETKGSG
jgi:tetratricopeptide (TPR) repeat protein